jgi:hypothetical protein
MIRTDNSKVIELLQSQLEEKENEIERLKGLFMNCWVTAKSFEASSQYPSFLEWAKSNNINLTPKQE